MELDYKAIGKRIKIARINADMTQEHLSDLIELSPSHMSNIVACPPILEPVPKLVE